MEASRTMNDDKSATLGLVMVLGLFLLGIFLGNHLATSNLVKDSKMLWSIDAKTGVTTLIPNCIENSNVEKH